MSSWPDFIFLLCLFRLQAEFLLCQTRNIFLNFFQKRKINFQVYLSVSKAEMAFLYRVWFLVKNSISWSVHMASFPAVLVVLFLGIAVVIRETHLALPVRAWDLPVRDKIVFSRSQRLDVWAHFQLLGHTWRSPLARGGARINSAIL